MQENELFAAIANRIGPELAQEAVGAIIETWGGESQMIPNGVRMRNRLRNQEIRDLFSRGLSPGAIAERFNLSVRHVIRLISATNQKQERSRFPLQ